MIQTFCLAPYLEGTNGKGLAMRVFIVMDARHRLEI